MSVQTLTPAQKLALRNDVPAVGTAAITVVYALALWSARAKQRRELSRLGPNMMEDIGLTETARKAECAKPFWRP